MFERYGARQTGLWAVQWVPGLKVPGVTEVAGLNHDDTPCAIVRSWKGSTHSAQPGDYLIQQLTKGCYDVMKKADFEAEYRPLPEPGPEPGPAVRHGLSRQEVYAAIDREREYQDAKWGPIPDRHGHEVGSWLLIVENCLAQGRAAYAHFSGDKRALDQLRKLVAVGVACLEQHGCPPRDAKGGL